MEILEWSEKYTVFRLDNIPFITQVEQRKLDSCSMGCLFEILQGQCYRHVNLLFSENLEQFSKNSNLKPKNSKGV